jgi:hypothetical protein
VSLWTASIHTACPGPVDVPLPAGQARVVGDEPGMPTGAGVKSSSRVCAAWMISPGTRTRTRCSVCRSRRGAGAVCPRGGSGSCVYTPNSGDPL